MASAQERNLPRRDVTSQDGLNDEAGEGSPAVVARVSGQLIAGEGAFRTRRVGGIPACGLERAAILGG